MSEATVWLDRTTGNWWHMVEGRWTYQGNLRDVARNAERPDSEVIINFAEARARQRPAD